MKAYVRPEANRNSRKEMDQWSPVEEAGGGQRPLSRGGEAWQALVSSYGAACAEMGPAGAKLAAQVSCARFELRGSLGCGREVAAGPWCGLPTCLRCARARAQAVVRAARDSWPEAVCRVTIPMGRGGGVDLPSVEAVAAVRVAWSQATRQASEAGGFPRVEHSPRTVITPDGLEFFFAPPEGSEGVEEALLQRLGAACRQAGLRGVDATLLSREAAALAAARAVSLEAERFLDGMREELQRSSQPQATARRWAHYAAARLESARRQTVLGGRETLTWGESGGASFSCPGHGSSCAPQGVRIRDFLEGGRVVWQGGPLSPRQLGRQQLTRFCAALAAGTQPGQPRLRAAG